MFNRQSEAFRQVHRTMACHRDMHAECPHMLGTGGGFNASRRRFEFGVGLCSCDCHTRCPISSAKQLISGQGLIPGQRTISARTWLESCACPGAEAERIRLDEAGYEFPDIDEVWAASRPQRQSRQEAFEAARAQAAGKSHEQVKELYLAELRARGLETGVSQDVLDATVAVIIGGRLAVARITVQALIDSVKRFRATGGFP